MKHEEITRNIIGAAMRVHSTLRNGYQELIYQRCLEIEFRKSNIDFQREVEQIIFYEGENVGTRRVDFVVNGNIIVELKAVIMLEPVHLAQAINYLEAFHLEIGLLINFGAKELEFKRIHNNKLL